MLKKTKKLTLNAKVLRFFLIPVIFVSVQFFNDFQESKAGLEFQWDQNSGYRRLKWFQKENKRKFRFRKGVIYITKGTNYWYLKTLSTLQ